MSDSEAPGAAISAQQAVRGRPFQKGVSGNPSGRPAASKRIREMAQLLGDRAVEGLLALATDKKAPAAVRRQAWVDLLDRGFGKPTVGTPDDDGTQVARVEYAWTKGE